MFCSKCGKEIDESGQFCKYCGASVKGDSTESAQERSKQYPEDVHTYDMPRMVPLDMMEKYEKIVFETHPSKMGAFFSHVAGGVLLVAGGITMLILLDFFALRILGAALIVAGLIIGLVGYLKWRSIIYALTTNRMIVLKGIFSKDLYENHLDKVQDIRLQIDMRQRLYNCGDISISTAGTAGIECMWKDIPDARKKQALLRTVLAK